MSFAAPVVLLALLALPLLVGWYLSEQRRRREAAEAFALPALQPAIAPERPRWRRHLPALAVLLALAALVMAAARPQRTVAVPVERATIVLATDVSGSMEATDVQPNRLVAAKRAAREFVAEVPKRVNIAVIGFNAAPRVLASPTRDRAAVDAAIERLGSSGGTAAGEAIHAALSVIGKEGNKRPPAAIVLLSDGATTSGRDPVDAARTAGDAKVPVYTVALGTRDGTITVPRRGGGTEVRPVPPDPRALEEMAEVSGGRSFTATSTAGLEDVYERLGSRLGRRDEKRQITSAFAGGGLLLMLAGVGMSLRWFGRLV